MARSKAKGKGKAEPSMSASGRRPQTHEQRAQKIIYDNFKGFSHTQTDVYIGTSGLTLRATLVRDLREHADGKRVIVWGLTYYDRLRCEYRHPDDPYSLLAPKDGEAAASPAFMRAAGAALDRHPDRSKIQTWMQAQSKVSNTELRGLYRLALRLRPRCSTQTDTCAAILRFVHRLGLQNSEKEDGIS